MKPKRKITYKEFIQFHIDYMKVVLIVLVGYVIIFMIMTYIAERTSIKILCSDYKEVTISVIYVVNALIIYIGAFMKMTSY